MVCCTLMGQLHVGENQIHLIAVKYFLPKFIRLSLIVPNYYHVNMLIEVKCRMPQLMDFSSIFVCIEKLIR